MGSRKNKENEKGVCYMINYKKDKKGQNSPYLINCIYKPKKSRGISL